VADTETFEEWIYAVRKICKKHNVTHFCTGNKEDILDVLKKNGETLGFEMINPEEGTDFPYHATDIRKLIVEGEYFKLKDLIPEEVFPILFRNTFKEIGAATVNRGIHFVPGRQTVDLVFLVRDIKSGNVYVLLGKRSKEKVDFPKYYSLIGGEIEEFESPIIAAINNFYKETGLKIEILDNSLEPAIVKLENIDKANLEQMHIVGIYSSEDEIYAGTRGGSSQCFGLFVEADIANFTRFLKTQSDNFDKFTFVEISEALSKKLAYQHADMIKKAVTMFSAYPDLLKKI
jgi:8-oxo-dGTP pyrophosphatase MutT (NUDIX family)